MRKLRKSDYFLLVGFLVLIAGAVMSVKEIEPEANYVLIAGAVLVVIRGLIRTHERDDEHNE
ncbi:MAG: hypothetical protein II551_00240 [Paludibacteraceae bacterium]|nr:hypothetical protein [Paludibacteraceae bacterium]